MKLRILLPMLSVAVSVGGAAGASGFVDARPDVAIEAIPETMRTSDDDYPPESRRAEQQGIVMLLVTVGTDGRAKACSIYRSSRAKPLDERSCTLAMERFRFRPARRDGVAVEDKAILPVDWRLDLGDSPPPALTNPLAQEVAPRLTPR